MLWFLAFVELKLFRLLSIHHEIKAFEIVSFSCITQSIINLSIAHFLNNYYWLVRVFYQLFTFERNLELLLDLAFFVDLHWPFFLKYDWVNFVNKARMIVLADDFNPPTTLTFEDLLNCCPCKTTL